MVFSLAPQNLPSGPSTWKRVTSGGWPRLKPNDAFTVDINSQPVLVELEGADTIAVGATDSWLYLHEPTEGTLIDRILLNGGVWFSRPLVLDRPDGGQELWVGTSGEGGHLNRVVLDDREVEAFTT